MGVKRNVDTGRKDKLGRPIKVSARQLPHLQEVRLAQSP